MGMIDDIYYIYLIVNRSKVSNSPSNYVICYNTQIQRQSGEERRAKTPNLEPWRLTMPI